MKPNLPDDLDLASLLCTRLCHDLVGPVGAVGNGIEILADEDDPAMQRQALELLEHSAEQASRKLRFFRLAFGLAKADSGEILIGEIRALAQALLEGGRINLAWPDDAAAGPAELPLMVAKLLLNMILLASESLPRGGNVAVRLDASGADLGLFVGATGDGARLTEASEYALGQTVDTSRIEPRAAAAIVAARMAGAVGHGLEISRHDGAVDFGVRLDSAA